MKLNEVKPQELENATQEAIEAYNKEFDSDVALIEANHQKEMFNDLVDFIQDKNDSSKANFDIKLEGVDDNYDRIDQTIAYVDYYGESPEQLAIGLLKQLRECPPLSLSIIDENGEEWELV